MNLGYFPLSRFQTVFMAAYGVVFWLVAAMIIHVLAPMGVFEGSSRNILYLLIIPGTAPVVWLAVRLAKLRREQVYVGFSFATGVAAMLDGLALIWLPGLYGGAMWIADAGAVILWGAGVGILLAIPFSRAAVN